MELITDWEIVAEHSSFRREPPTPYCNRPLFTLFSLTGCKTTEIFTSMCTKGSNSFINARGYKMAKENKPQIRKDGKDDEEQRCCRGDAGGGHPARRGSPDGGFDREDGGRSRLTTWEASGEGGRGPGCGSKGGRHGTAT